MWFDLQQWRSFFSKFRIQIFWVQCEWGMELSLSDHIAMHCSFHQWQKIIKIQIFSVFPVQIFCIMFRMMLILNPRFFVAIISQIQMFHAPNLFSEFVDSTYDLLHQFLECQCLPSWSMVHVILNIESQQPTYMTNSIKLNMLDGTDEDRKVRFASVFCQNCQYNLAFNFGYLPN